MKLVCRLKVFTIITKKNTYKRIYLSLQVSRRDIAVDLQCNYSTLAKYESQFL